MGRDHLGKVVVGPELAHKEEVNKVEEEEEWHFCLDRFVNRNNW